MRKHAAVMKHHHVVAGIGLVDEVRRPEHTDALVDALVVRAKADSLSRVFALTLAPGFFERMGFRTIEHRDLPLKVWTDCVACPNLVA